MQFEWDENKNRQNLKKLRIISARKATPKERKAYYEYFSEAT
jgi:uncharacterized DUF497 family protein